MTRRPLNSAAADGNDAAPGAAAPGAAVPDAAVPDAAVPDAAVPDAAVPDAAVPDSNASDPAAPDPTASDPAEVDAAGTAAALEPVADTGPTPALLATGTTVALVAAGGALGAGARYVVDLMMPYAPSLAFSGIPYATLSVNVLGCLALGIIIGATEHRPGTPAWISPLVKTGFLGAFTTVSAFSSQFATMLGGLFVTGALAYGLATLAGCLAAAGIGVWIGGRFSPLPAPAESGARIEIIEDGSAP